jgi:hypothetical protein
MPTGRRALVFAGLAAVVLTSAAAAGPPGSWTRAGKRPGSDAFEAGLARTADGVLHIVSLREDGTKVDLWQVRIDSDGRLVGSNEIAAAWSRLANPDLVLTSDGGLRVLFGGAHTDDPTETAVGVLSATAPATGVPWTLDPDPVVTDAASASADVGAGVAKDGSSVVAWVLDGSLRYHWGVGPTSRDFTVPRAGCCPTNTDVATDSLNGQTYVGWFSGVARASGVFVQAIGLGGPLGRPLYAPGSSGKNRSGAAPPGQRVAIAARNGGPGVYVAYAVGYPKVRSVGLWRVGQRTTVLRLAALGATDVALASSLEGRLWLAWQQNGRIFATRTNRAATKTEPIRALMPPPRTTGIWRVAGEGSLGPLDLVANVDATGGTTFWHQQLLPVLSLDVTATAQQAGSTRYVFDVTDAGDAVPNATVRFGTQTLTTGAAGTVTLTTSDRPATATASKPGYVSGSASIPTP